MLKAVTLVALVACTDPEVPVGPEFAVDVTRIDLGANRCGTEQTRTVTVHNPRDERLELTIATTTTDIAVAPDFLAIEPGDTFAFAVRTTMPAVPGDVVGELLLTPGSGIPFRMPVTYASTGLALTIPAIVDAGERSPGLGFTSIPIRSVGSGTARVTVGSAAPFERLSQAPIELAGSSFQFADFQISMPFGLVDRFVPITVEGEVCGTPPQQVELVAAGTVDELRLDHTRLELGAIGCGTPAVALAVTNASLAPAVLLTDLDDPSGMLEVSDAPSIALPAGERATLMIETRAAAATPSTVVESTLGLGLGTAVRALRIRGVVTRPLLEASTPDLVLGDIARDATATRSLTIANRGNAPATVTLSAGVPLIVAPAEFVLAPNATRRITVTVERAAPAGLFSAEIRGVLANCEAEPLAVTARGTIVAE